MQQNFGTLFIVATPIGNLGDISARALATLREVSAIACEDTRNSGNLCAHFGIKTPLISYHDHNEAQILPKLLEKLQAGADIALISDAGTPLISDPGYRLVREAAGLGIKISPIAGACSIIAALSAGGLPTDKFYFAGFLPNKQQMRRARLEELSRIDATIIAFESPRRLCESLQDAAYIMGERQAVVAREITKLYEEFRRATLSELATYYAENSQVKGEIVLIIAPQTSAKPPENMAINAVIEALLPTCSTKQIAKMLSEITPLSKGEIYEMALKLKGGS